MNERLTEFLQMNPEDLNHHNVKINELGYSLCRKLLNFDFSIEVYHEDADYLLHVTNASAVRYAGNEFDDGFWGDFKYEVKDADVYTADGLIDFDNPVLTEDDIKYIKDVILELHNENGGFTIKYDWGKTK